MSEAPEPPLEAAADACPTAALREAVGPRSVVFVLVDTLRRDRLGAYGGSARTPVFDALAAEGLRFERAWANAPWTKPSIATLFTGLHPSQHGVVSHPRLRGDVSDEAALNDVLGSSHETLAEALAAAGWHTGGIVTNPWLGAAFGFAQGFASWDDTLAANDAPGPRVSRAALRWIEALPDDDRPFFLYLHYMDPHEPYRMIPEAALAARRAAIEADARPVEPAWQHGIGRLAVDERGQQIAARGVPNNLALLELAYDLGVEAFDRALGVLVDGLAAMPRAEDALLVLTSDHGQALYRRGWQGHGHGLFADETGIPLLMRGRGIPVGVVVDCPVGLVDLRSTLCDLLGVACAGPDAGRSLLEPGDESRIVLSEAVRMRPRHRAARDVRYTLLHEPDGRTPPTARAPTAARRLFDHVADPEGEEDLLAETSRSPAVEQALDRLTAALDHGIEPIDIEAPERVPLDAATRSRLEALGYAEEESAP
ncbi:MAG: sulfatase [Myxococcota bacterium]